MTKDHMTPGAIDVHVHFLPDAYRRAAIDAGYRLADGLAPPGLPEWSAERHLEVMDGLGVETAVLSVSSPGVLLYDEPARVAELARIVNDEGAAVAAAHPGRFGFFASLPLPDVEASLEEIRRAFDELGADGVVLMTNYRGVYPGDPRLAPVFAELSRREAVVLLHPTSPACAVDGVMVGWQRPMIEFFFESTRTVTDLILTRTLSDNPGIRLIVAHAGAALPALASRVARNVHRRNAAAGPDERLPDFDESLANLWYDLAGSVYPHQVPALLGIARRDHVLYGSDWPFTAAETAGELRRDFEKAPEFTAEDRQAILRGNAAGLLARFGAQAEH
ncbi:amidohydrolase family protein [Actinomadura scrupuli]|uniref:amidohydrolase family protein n=1 Tax=Actinomadura scrupuli TaxID=559629 RepID=UPI003D97E27C